jgi:hypothetical protein
MPRRAKLFLAILFLLLVALPVGYLALTWYPSEPLRFRILSEDEWLDVDLSDAIQYPFMAENRNSVPVHLYYSYGEGTFMPYRSRKDQEVLRKWQTIIPARSSVIVGAYHAVILPENVLVERIHYLSASSTKDSVTLAAEWCHQRSPGFLRPYIPEFKPDVHAVSVGEAE